MYGAEVTPSALLDLLMGEQLRRRDVVDGSAIPIVFTAHLLSVLFLLLFLLLVLLLSSQGREPPETPAHQRLDLGPDSTVFLYLAGTVIQRFIHVPHAPLLCAARARRVFLFTG